MNSPADETELVALAARVRALETAVTQLQAQLAGSQLSGIEGASLVDDVQEAPGASQDLETLVGTYWLSRIGVLALITGIAWFIALHFGQLGPAARVALGYGLGALLAAVGVWFARSQRLFGHVVIGGALAEVYFVTYALHFVAPVRVIDNQTLGLVLLAVVVLSIVGIAQRLGSETIAGIALFLGFHTSFAGESHPFTLLSTTLLAAAALFLVVKNRWVMVPFTSLAAVYLGHAFGSARHAPVAPTRADALIALTFALVYFVLFAAAILLRPRQHSRRFALGFSLANGFAFVLLGVSVCFRYDRPLVGPFLGVATSLLLGSAWMARTPVLVESHLALALGTFTWVLAESLPSSVAGIAGALVLAASFAFAVRTSMRGVPVAALAALAALLIAGSTSPNPSGLAFLALAAAFVVCVHRTRAHEHESWRRGLRVGGSLLSAAAALGAASTFAGSYLTLGWVVVALVLVGVGLALRERALRLTGLGVLALAAGKLLLFDLARLPTDQRILTFVLSGALLLGLSFAYSRFKDSLQRLL